MSEEKKGVIATAWEKFSDVFPNAEVGSAPYIALRTAFYGGAQALLAISTNTFEDGDELTEADEAFMNGIAGELQEFVEEVMVRAAAQRAAAGLNDMMDSPAEQSPVAP